MPKIYVGLDVSLETTSVCAVDEDGVIRLEAKAISDPAAIAAALTRLDGVFERVGFEAGPLSQWLFFGLRDAGLPAVCIEARHAKAAIGAMSANRTDRNDARAIAQLVRSGWFKTVHVKSVESQELRTLLVTREFFVNKLRDHENEVRGLARARSASRLAASAPPSSKGAFASSCATARGSPAAWRRCCAPAPPSARSSRRCTPSFCG